MNTIEIIVPLIVSFLVFASPIGVIIGIIKLVLVRGITDPEAKKKAKKTAWIIFFGPLLALIVTIMLWGFVKIIIASFF